MPAENDDISTFTSHFR